MTEEKAVILIIFLSKLSEFYLLNKIMLVELVINVILFYCYTLLHSTV